jgi:two-component system, sensor histidine kinase and response regulator
VTLRIPVRLSSVALVAGVGIVAAAVYTVDRELTRAGSVPILHVELYALGIIIGILAVAVARERRYSRRISERLGELERLSAELLRANRAKSEFLANVSHELRTPLNAIVGFVDLLRDGVYGELSPRQVAPVGRIEASASHLRHLVDQILDLAKMTAGRLEVHLESVDLRPFILDVAADVEPLANEKGLLLSLSVGPLLPRLQTDPTHLRQILMNLLGNAVKYTLTGSITLRARMVAASEVPATLHRSASGNHPAANGRPANGRPANGRPANGRPASGRPTSGRPTSGRPTNGHPTNGPPAPVSAVGVEPTWLAIHVSDTGVGIAAPDQSRIFEEFEQGGVISRGDSTKRGTGLGLTISRRLARFLGGDIILESDVGKGSTFTLWLPVEGEGEGQ